jgi:ankyrin
MSNDENILSKLVNESEESIKSYLKTNLTHLSGGTFNVDWQNPHGRTMLHFSAEFEENVRITKVLVSMGGDPNLYNSEGYSPFHLAVMYGNVKTVETLLQNGANVHKHPQNNINFTPLHMASMALKDITGDRNIDIAKLLISYGADKNAVVFDRSVNRSVTALEIAQRINDYKMVEYLLLA